MKFRSVLYGLAAVWFAMAQVACVSTPRSTGSGGVPPRVAYRLAAPDVLQITVRGAEPVIQREITVQPDGRISFDLIGEVDVQGKTLPEVRNEIVQRLKEFIVAPDVTVVLQGSTSRRYFVFGEVNRVGAYPIAGEVTAVEAIAQAGGPTLLANANGSWLSRPTGDTAGVYRIYFDRITRGDGSSNYVLQPGDVIYVPPGASAQLGQALQVIFFPLQQIIGLGGGVFSRVARGGA